MINAWRESARLGELYCATSHASGEICMHAHPRECTRGRCWVAGGEK